MGFFSRRDPTPDTTADGDHLQSRTYRRPRTGHRHTPEATRYPRKADRPDPNFAVESPTRANTPKRPEGYIER